MGRMKKYWGIKKECFFCDFSFCAVATLLKWEQGSFFTKLKGVVSRNAFELNLVNLIFLLVNSLNYIYERI